MSAFFNYMVEANLSICFFLLVYQLVLKKETDFLFKRGYLLLALLVSILAPLLHFNISSAIPLNEAIQTYWLPEIRLANMLAVTAMNSSSLYFWIFVSYGVGVAIFLLLFIARLIKIRKTIFQSPRKSHGSICVIELPHSAEVFSFFKFIFIGQSVRLTENERRQVILHESVHVHNFHSLDILFINVITIFFWFNPWIKTYRKSLVQLHEFEADARSVKTHEVDGYCSLLAKAALNSSGYQLANHFTNSLTIKRIEMMKTMKTKIAWWKVTTVACTAFAFCLVVGCSHTKSLSNSSANEIYDQVDEMPTYGKGTQYTELFELIAKNLVYPKEARDSKIEGTVFAEFVVEKDGTLSNIKIVKGIGHGCDESVKQVLKQLPKWNPGEKGGKAVRTKMTLPILFKI